MCWCTYCNPFLMFHFPDIKKKNPVAIDPNKGLYEAFQNQNRSNLVEMRFP